MAFHRCITYVSDINFLLPSLVSALSVRDFIPKNDLKILIFVVDLDESLTKDINAMIKELDIEVQSFSSRYFSSISKDSYKKSHVPLAAIGRFYLNDLLPISTKEFIYLDGDTYVRKDPSDLVFATLKEDKLYAANDTLYYRQHNNFAKRGKDIRQYFSSLGLSKNSTYLNSGVFAVTKDLWSEIAEEAHDFLLNNTTLCLHHDQSALNAVIGERREKLSLKWNFQTPLRHMGVEQKIKPAIYHFTQSPKPWAGKLEPWRDIHQHFHDKAALFSGINLPLNKEEQNAIHEHNKHMYKKFIAFKNPIISTAIACLSGINKEEKEAAI